MKYILFYNIHCFTMLTVLPHILKHKNPTPNLQVSSVLVLYYTYDKYTTINHFHALWKLTIQESQRKRVVSVLYALPTHSNICHLTGL